MMIATETVPVDFAQPVAVFPLENCVLLPHLVTPLHVFEPRYREMVSDALDRRGVIAMAVFESPAPAEEYLHGRPALRPWVCVGHVLNYEALPDGRYIMLLQGLCRGRIVEETAHEPWRVFMLQPAEEPETDGDMLDSVRHRIAERLQDPAVDRLPMLNDLQTLIAREESAATALNILAAALCAEAEERYSMLAETDPGRRATWLLARVDAIVASLHEDDS